MTSDSITDEIRSIRHTLAAQCGNDVLTILADVRRREASDGRSYVTLSRRRAQEVLAEQPNAADVRESPAQDDPSAAARG